MNIKGFKDANGNIQKYDINALATSFIAKVGQVLVVESVDENGHPNGFSVVDQPNGVEITSSSPTKEGTVLTINPNAEEKLIYEADEVDEIAENLENQIKEIGGVEVTSGEPIKENTVLIIDPNEEELHFYEKEEIDVMFGSYATDVATLIGGIEP